MTILHGDCRDVMAGMDAASVDAIVTDPPYGLAFMGRDWDHGIPGPAFWMAALRVAKPGSYLLAFGGTRTFHRLTCAIEDAGWEVKDCLMWLHGQGFPKHKSLLKPGWEPIVLAKKPGAGVLNIDACRIEGPVDAYAKPGNGQVGSGGVYEGGYSGDYHGATEPHPLSIRHHAAGRWPANVVLDEDAAAALDAMSGERKCGGPQSGKRYADQPAGWSGGTNNIGRNGDARRTVVGYSDTGGASRFFYCAKASRTERNAGLDGMPERLTNRYSPKGQGPLPQQTPSTVPVEGNHHPTVKPLALMRWLVRLVTPPDGLVLDPFAGSGTTGVACAHEGFRFVGIEQEAEYVEIAERRIRHATPPLFADIPA